MKSSIKIDYAGLHEGLDQENKQPLIRINLQKSDDPRDTLLNDLVTPTTVFGFRLRSTNDDSTTYVLYSKNRNSQICELAESVYNVFRFICVNTTFLMAISNEEIYFETFGINDNYKRSKGLNRNEVNFLQNDEVTKLLVEDFLKFKDDNSII